MICHQNARVRVLATAIAAALTLFGLSSRSALAASITVNTTNMKYVADAQCGLAEAINAVNIGKAFDGCTAPNGNKDTINVMTAGTYTALTASTMPPSVQAAVARAAKHPVRLQ